MYAMTQSIVIQVGQCGNQIGSRFWELALKEHNLFNPKIMHDQSLYTFFRCPDETKDFRYNDNYSSVPKTDLQNIKARAVLIDMEEGVVNRIRKSRLNSLFDTHQLITDVSGSGNNWAVGFHQYGSIYKDKILDIIRRETEHCDSLQSFFVIHSMGGGTGSGLGTRIMSLLDKEYSDVFKFAVPVFPVKGDDVVTSPYNSVLALRLLSEHSDFIIPMDNEALIDIAIKCAPRLSKVQDNPFNSMNEIVANVLLDMTSSARFEGTINVDLNEIAMNLVPFPRMQFILSSIAPLKLSNNSGLLLKHQEKMFMDSINKDFQLMNVCPKDHIYMACALLLRGQIKLSDIHKNLEKLCGLTEYTHWNPNGWKFGHCSIPPIDKSVSLLSLCNNTGIVCHFENLIQNFQKLYRRKAHLHHYLSVNSMCLEEFDFSVNLLKDLINSYKNIENLNFKFKSEAIPKVQIL